MNKASLKLTAALIFAFSGYINAQPAMTNLSSMPLAFTENQGQFGEKALFKAEAGGATFYFCTDEVAYLFVRNTDELIESESINEYYFSENPNKEKTQRLKQEAMLVKSRFIGANPNTEVVGIDRLPYNNNYFFGNDPSKWRTDVPNYSSVVYKDIYPGIDLKYYGDGLSMKYDFIVSPGADISQIQINYDGVDNLDITPAGDLQAATQFGPIQEKTPYIYQEIDGIVQQVSGRYELIEPGVFGFAVDDYDLDHPLVIDPELLYSTYFGGSDDDYIYDIELGQEGNMYIVGITESPDFPIVAPYDSTYNGNKDIFVSKLSPSGDSIIYSTYLGGSDDDYSYDMAVDNTGNIFLAGDTRSIDFPVINAFDDSLGGESDFIATKLSGDGNVLLFSTYIGGSGDERTDILYGSCGIVIDNENHSYITGMTESPDFPVLNAYDDGFNGVRDAFLSKLSVDGSSLIFSTFLGGSDLDQGQDIAIDAEGCLFLAGFTVSADFPTVNAFDDSINGSADVFISKFSPGGDSLIFSTFLGGSATEHTRDIALDNDGNVFIAGRTSSSDFPMMRPYQETKSGGMDIFVTKMINTGDSLIFSSFLGGSEWDWCADIAVDNSGDIHIMGYTQSPDFPVLNYIEGYNGGNMDDVIFAMFTNNTNCLGYSTYLGGSYNDRGHGIAVDAAGIVCVVGDTESPNFPMVNPIDSVQSSHEGFISKADFTGDSYQGTLHCLVWDSDYEPIEGVDIIIDAIGTEAETDVDGECVFENLCANLYSVRFEHPEYCDTTADNIWVPAGDINDLYVILYESGDLAGIVSDSDNEPIEGVQIIVEQTGYEYITGEDGQYFINDLCLGDYDITFSHTLHCDSTVSYTVVDGDMHYFDMSLTMGGSITGIVTDTASNIIEGVEVIAEYSDYACTTNVSGEYILNDICEGADNIMFTHPDYASYYVNDFAAGREDTTILNAMLWPPPATDVAFWYGNLDGSPVEAVPGQMVSIDLYAQTAENAYVHDLILALAVDDQYFDCYGVEPVLSFYYPLSEWDIDVWEPFNDSPSPPGWTSLSFIGSARFSNPDGPLLHVETPSRILTYVIQVVDDSSLVGDTISCLASGEHPYAEAPYAGDSLGGPGYAVIEYFSPVTFVQASSFAYLPGDANMYNGIWPPQCIGGDVTYLVNYFRGNESSQPCELNGFWCSADANGDCSIIGSDVTRLVNYFRGNVSLLYCPDYEPLWLTPDDLPDEAPDGWPGCE